MKLRRILTIEQCEECPYLGNGDCGHPDACLHADAPIDKRHEAFNRDDIPTWCPLPERTLPPEVQEVVEAARALACEPYGYYSKPPMRSVTGYIVPCVPYTRLLEAVSNLEDSNRTKLDGREG